MSPSSLLQTPYAQALQAICAKALQALEAATNLPGQLDVILAGLGERIRSGGRVIVTSTADSRYMAAHFYEELAVRYKSVKGRADRAAISTVLVDSLDQVASWCSPQDALVIFSGSEDAADAIKKGSNAGAFVSFIGPSLLGNTCDSALFSVFQSLALHALCEGLEPDAGAEPVRTSILEFRGLLQTMASDTKLAEGVNDAARIITAVLDENGAIACCGNGGSACDALELAAHLNAKWSGQKKARATHFMDPSFLTCCYNDGFSPFVRGVEGMKADTGVLVAYSTSGNSRNVLDAVHAAKKKGIKTVAFTGAGGELATLADCALRIPSTVTARIQEGHALAAATLISL